jgi:ankyrin repeat domain-containing protein 50
MADPFSVAGSVVGVASLGITVAQGLVDYYGAWKGCGDDIKSTLASLQDLSSILNILRSKLSQSQRLQGHEIQLEKTIGSCTDVIAKLDNKLKKIQKNGKQSQFERLRYPFRRGTIGKLQDLITELRGNLQLLLEVVHVDVASTHTVKLDYVTSTLVGLDRKVDDFQFREELRQIRLWLNAPDPKVNHAAARQKHEPQTGSWFVDSGDFSNWLSLPNSTFWLHGLRK